MKTSKAIIISLLIFLILSTIFISKNLIIALAVDYLPSQAKAMIKVLINKGSENERLSNDYNEKFLPETQIIKLKFKKFRFDVFSNAEAGYYQKLAGQSKSPYKSFFIDIFNKDILVITDALGKSYMIKNLQNLASSNKNLASIPSNIKPTKVLDTYIYKDNLFISYIDQSDNCRNFVISKAKINKKFLEFKEFFREEKCATFIQGGRMQSMNFQNKLGLLFSIADNIADKPNNDPQSDSSNYGKIIFKSFDKDKEIIYSKGHRNPQGLLVSKNLILSTEHGPKGGDEINKIEYKKNYGWPISSYGTKYSSNFDYAQSHTKLGFQDPIFAFVPSIGISEIIKVPNTFNKYWKENFIISSLNKKSLFRVKFDEDFSKIIYFEEIFIGQRIRDIKILNKNILLALEGKGELGVLTNYE